MFRIKDLGKLDGTVLAYGGIYSNLDAFTALQNKVARYAPSTAICLGDISAYCAHPAACVNAVVKHRHHVVAGNCERQLAQFEDDCGCGFESGSACDLLSASWYAHANRQISVAQRSWMRDLPDIIQFNQNGVRTAAIHGGVTDVARFLWSTSPEREFHREIDVLENAVGRIDRILAGHSGIPFIRRIGSVEWVNVGAIGMPANDGLISTSFVLLGSTIRIRRLDYDVEAARAAMIEAGLIQGYHDTLRTGLWPSQDVLPFALKQPSELVSVSGWQADDVRSPIL